MEQFSVTNFMIDYYYGGLITCDENWHGYDEICAFCKFYYLLDGECGLVIDGRAYHAQPGQWFLIPAGTRHSFYHISDNYLTKYWFHFNLECGGTNFFEYLALPDYIDAGLNRELKQRFSQVLDAAGDGTMSGQLRLKAGVLDLVSDYLSRSGVTEQLAATGDVRNMERLNQYISQNLSRQLTLQELADVVHFHPNYLIRFFKNKTGMAPMKYIARLKIERAKYLLEHTQKPIGEIVQELGFNDGGHFYKRFRLFCGQSPTEFRRLYQK